MKKKTVTALLALALLASSPARAWVAAGGYHGGVAVGYHPPCCYHGGYGYSGAAVAGAAVAGAMVGAAVASSAAPAGVLRLARARVLRRAGLVHAGRRHRRRVAARRVLEHLDQRRLVHELLGRFLHAVLLERRPHVPGRQPAVAPLRLPWRRGHPTAAFFISAGAATIRPRRSHSRPRARRTQGRRRIPSTAFGHRRRAAVGPRTGAVRPRGARTPRAACPLPRPPGSR